jgi:putative methanogen marker protein 4
LMDLDGLLDRGLGCSCRIGVGLSKDAIVRTHQELSARRAKTRIVRFKDARSLAESLAKGNLDGAVRGTLSSSEMLVELKRVFSLKRVERAAILEDINGRRFLLAPVGIDEGMDRRSRLEIALDTISYFSKIGWKLDVGVLSKGRLEDRGRSRNIGRSLDDGMWLVRELKIENKKAEHFGILFEDAVAKSDFVLAPDGVIGNLMFRSMHFIGGGRAYGAPVVNLGSIFVDTSRTKASFADPILLAAGLVSSLRTIH